MKDHVIATCNFASGFSTYSACQKPVVKCANGDHIIAQCCGGYKCLVVAKCPNLDHMTAEIAAMAARTGCKDTFSVSS